MVFDSARFDLRPYTGFETDRFVRRTFCSWEDAGWRSLLVQRFEHVPVAEDMALPAAAGTGFVYASALMGVTGTRDSVDEAAAVLTRRLRAVTDLPVCVGMGISDAGQAAEVAGFADGVIVGSAIVRTLLDHLDDEEAGLEALRALVEDLAAGVRRGRD